MSVGTVLGFEVEWYDPVAQDVKKLYLKFWIEDNTLELLKPEKGQAAFLKKIHYPQVRIQDLYLGSTLTIYNRTMVITSYANTFTKDYMVSREVHFLVVIPASRISSLSKVLNTARRFALSMGRVRTAGSSVRDFLESGDVIMEMVGISGHDGDEFPSAMNTADRNIIVQNVGVDEITEYLEKCSQCACRPGTSLCIIKPHVIKDGLAGDLIDDIKSAGFDIEAVFSIHMSLPIAETLFSVYRGLHPSYSQSMQHLVSGPVLALLISGGLGRSCVEAFRELCGPVEPELGRILYPDTLRAKYGLDAVYNAVHCTDLEEDGEMETKYIFETLAAL